MASTRAPRPPERFFPVAPDEFWRLFDPASRDRVAERRATPTCCICGANLLRRVGYDFDAAPPPGAYPARAVRRDRRARRCSAASASASEIAALIARWNASAPDGAARERSRRRLSSATPTSTIGATARASAATARRSPTPTTCATNSRNSCARSASSRCSTRPAAISTGCARSSFPKASTISAATSSRRSSTRTARATAAPARRFLAFDIAADVFPDADLWFCRDCLFHLPTPAALAALRGFARSRIGFVMTTTHLNVTGFRQYRHRRRRLPAHRPVQAALPAAARGALPHSRLRLPLSAARALRLVARAGGGGAGERG